MKKVIVLMALLFAAIVQAQNAGRGVISGKVVDAESGAGLFGSNVYMVGTQMGAATDMHGAFRINHVPEGTYTLRVSYMGYKTVNVTDVKVTADNVTSLNISLIIEAVQGETVVITAKAIRNTDAVLLKDRQKSASVSDAVSAEAISRAGGASAADAMKQVTGASVVDGKYIFVRGLGDRYTSTQLNGAEMPSTNPYKRAASVDIIPSNLLDNIVTVKSFTPDKPGNFSGGTVDIRTKDFPEHLTLSFSTSTSFNPQTHLKSNAALLYDRGGKDWLGFDDGSREIPALLSDSDVQIPINSEAGQDAVKAAQLDALTKSFNRQMTPEAFTFPLNSSYAFSIGNQFQLAGRPLGYMASLSYARSFSNYANGTRANWGLGGHVDQVDALFVDYDLKDHKSSDEVSLGGMLKLSYKLTPGHIVSVNALYNRSGESFARYLEGLYPYETGDNLYQSNVIGYVERAMRSLQARGEHQIKVGVPSTLNWQASYSDSKQDEPDNRFFTTTYDPDSEIYNIKLGHTPTRYWRNLDEDRAELTVDYTVPFTQWSGKVAELKAGGLYARKNRNYAQRKFVYQAPSAYDYDGDPEAFFSDENLGVVDTLHFTLPDGSLYTRYDFGLFIQEPVDWVAQYSGEQHIGACYLMLDLPVSRRLRFIGGVRLETTRMEVATADPLQPAVTLDEKDFLPSANAVYTLGASMNLRAAYGRTLALPTFREAVPYKSYEFMGGFEYKGNPELERTLIDNFDLRWEYFPQAGEIFAVSGFYKHFTQPIEQKIFTQAEKVITWQNVDEARVMGLEIEMRKRLGALAERLRDFSLGANLTLVHSTVDIAADELALIRTMNPYRDASRPMAGQSPYLLNVNLSYDNLPAGISASLYYNVFGERLAFTTEGGAPDVYERPFHLLNANLSFKPLGYLEVKLSAKNLLDAKVQKTLEFEGRAYDFSRFQRGRTYGVALQYSL